MEKNEKSKAVNIQYVPLIVQIKILLIKCEDIYKAFKEYISLIVEEYYIIKAQLSVDQILDIQLCS